MTDTQFFEVQDKIVEPVFPCRCGEVHRGLYAIEDWVHHNCFHSSELLVLDDHDSFDLRGQALCVDCGQIFQFSLEKE